MKLGAVVASVVFGALAVHGMFLMGWVGPEVQVVKKVPRTNPYAPPPISETGPHPKAVVDEIEHDFGSMILGDEGKHTFVIRNEGKGPMAIKKGRTTCKCTISDIKDGTVAPGESASIEVSWTPKKKREQFRHTAYILTDDPENRKLRLTVRGSVESFFVVSPTGEWNVGQIQEDLPTEISGTVGTTFVDDFQVTGIDCPNPHVTAEAVRLDEAETKELDAKVGYKIKVTIEPKVALGWFRTRLVVHTDARENSDLVFDLAGYRTGPFQLMSTSKVTWDTSSASVELGRFEAKKGLKVNCLMFVKGLGEQELEILGVESADDAIQLAVAPVPGDQGKSRKQYFLTFEIPPGPQVYHPIGRAVELTMKTNHPSAPTLLMHVTYISY
jgi:hypothetical protein